MKVAITSTGKNMDSSFDTRFGRTKYFIVADTETGDHETVDNIQNLNAAQGAGIQAARNVATAGANIVLTGHVGPNAFRTLQAANLKVYLCKGDTVKDIFDRFKRGEFNSAEQADVEGHWV